MGKDRFRAVFNGIVNLVLLQFFAGNMFRHAQSPDWFGILNRSTVDAEEALQAPACRDTPAGSDRCGKSQRAAQLRTARGVKFKICKRSARTAARSTSFRTPTP